MSSSQRARENWHIVVRLRVRCRASSRFTIAFLVLWSSPSLSGNVARSVRVHLHLIHFDFANKFSSSSTHEAFPPEKKGEKCILMTLAAKFLKTRGISQNRSARRDGTANGKREEETKGHNNSRHGVGFETTMPRKHRNTAFSFPADKLSEIAARTRLSKVCFWRALDSLIAALWSFKIMQVSPRLGRIDRLLQER